MGFFDYLRKRSEVGSLSQQELDEKNDNFFCTAACAWAAVGDTNAQLLAFASAIGSGDRTRLLRYLGFVAGGEPLYAERLTSLAKAVGEWPPASRNDARVLVAMAATRGGIDRESRRAFDTCDDQFFLSRYPKLMVVPLATAEKCLESGDDLLARLNEPEIRSKLDPELVAKLKKLVD
jgi:hypothetical protein